ncbi:MAG: hypothetical protein H0W40_10195 [Methylibium sp.]|uniref:ATPase domain-containing protein n=1 Tax=Methylibium sp. TaxID=2067992 RepID=UPI0017F1BB61|nr:ATPase domain-containing protein [Methylibium sp.]MBA3597731.1 hypothetical protein [Methylibium sp.]
MFVDSFRSVAQTAGAMGPRSALRNFVQNLAILLTSWHARTFLIGEYNLLDSEADPVFTIADGILMLTQSLTRNSMVRKIQVSNMRGQATIAGLHTFRITGDSIQVFPRTLSSGASKRGSTGNANAQKPPALSMGVPVLDEDGRWPAGRLFVGIGISAYFHSSSVSTTLQPTPATSSLAEALLVARSLAWAAA